MVLKFDNMKTLIPFLALMFPFGLFAQTQACVTCFGQTPTTVTITDPARYSEMVPCQGSGIPTYQKFYQRNRFKWYENSPGGTWEFKIKRDQITGGGNYVVRPVTSPFVEAAASSTTPYLRNLLREDLEPDNLPADGWELIRQDFGFANYPMSEELRSALRTANTIKGLRPGVYVGHFFQLYY